MQNRVLFIGPRYNLFKPTDVGGVVVLFEDLLDYCNKHNINYVCIDTNKENYKNRFIAYIVILYKIVVQTKKVRNVSLHGTMNDYLYIAPVALIIAKIYGKYFTLRKFAGNMIELFEGSPFIKKILLKVVLSYSDMNFFETKYLVNYFKQFNNKTFWFPNVRCKQSLTTSKNYEKKFIFLGSVSKEKGIDILCDAALHLSKKYQFHIYGQLHDDYLPENLQSHNITYMGELNHKDVISTLLHYDVLILPSFREGYPGVIIEALSVGLPIVATNLIGIREMVDNNSSILCEVGNVNDLKNAIEAINEKNYILMREAALKQFELFDSSMQTRKFITLLGL